MNVSIVVINYNTYELTKNCICSILENTHGIDYEIILVDNASDSFDESDFRKTFPSVKLILSKENLGFAKGNNLGIQHATGEFILLLNSDTYLKDNSIPQLAEHLRLNPRAAVVSGRLIYPTGEHQSVCQRFPSVKYQLIELLRLQKFMPRSIKGKLLLGAFFNHTENVTADWVWGTFFMFRKCLLEKLPGQKLDESYFMYCEDMQWCWDFKKLGYEIHYCSKAEIVHLMGGSSANKSNMISVNSEKFMKSNYSNLQRIFISAIGKMLQ